MKGYENPPNEGAWEFDTAWRATAVLGRCASTNTSLHGKAMAHPPLSSCGAEVVPCLGVLAAGAARLTAVDVRFKTRTPPHGFGVGEDRRPVREREMKHPQGGHAVLLRIYMP
jgi:hypothetical protein